jgi:hypothetical protein
MAHPGRFARTAEWAIVDKKPPPVKLDYHKPVEVFPTKTKAAIIFWLGVGLLVCFLAGVFAIGVLALLAPHYKR